MDKAAQQHFHRSLWPPVATGIAYYLAATVVLYLTRGGNGIATLWPSSGILFAVLLVASPGRGKWHVGAAAIASLVANMTFGTGVATSFVFTIANMAESLIAVWLLRTRAKCRVTFTDPGGLTCFCMAAGIGAVTSATLATISAPAEITGFWISWFATDLLGILVVTPLLLIVGRAVQRGQTSRVSSTVPELATMLGMVAIVAGFTFGGRAIRFSSCRCWPF